MIRSLVSVLAGGCLFVVPAAPALPPLPVASTPADAAPVPWPDLPLGVLDEHAMPTTASVATAKLNGGRLNVMI